MLLLYPSFGELLRVVPSISMSISDKLVYDKFRDLKKKSCFWNDIIKYLTHEFKYKQLFFEIRALPPDCHKECWEICYEKVFSAFEKVKHYVHHFRIITFFLVALDFSARK